METVLNGYIYIIKIKEDKTIGTNFYAKHIPTQEEYDAMQKALINKQLDKLQELITKATIQYHIGKRSYGWAFNFQAKEEPRQYWNNEEAQVPWEDNLDSLKEYLNRSDVQIIDEYGKEFTPEQFWNEEIGESLRVHSTKDRNYDSIETYYCRHPEERTYYAQREKVKDGIRWTYCWFG